MLLGHNVFYSVATTSSYASFNHTKVKTSDPVRSRKLSTFGPTQYCGGGPRGNRWCRTFLHFLGSLKKGDRTLCCSNRIHLFFTKRDRTLLLKGITAKRDRTLLLKGMTAKRDRTLLLTATKRDRTRLLPKGIEPWISVPVL